MLDVPTEPLYYNLNIYNDFYIFVCVYTCVFVCPIEEPIEGVPHKGIV